MASGSAAQKRALSPLPFPPDLPPLSRFCISLARLSITTPSLRRDSAIVRRKRRTFRPTLRQTRCKSLGKLGANGGGKKEKGKAEKRAGGRGNGGGRLSLISALVAPG